MKIELHDGTLEDSVDTVIFKNFDASIWGRDAREAWEALREAGPVFRVLPDMVVATSTAAVQQVLRDHAVFSSNPAAAYFGSESGSIPLQIDPPAHSGYRKILDPLFTPKKMAAREDQVRDLVNGLIDTFIARGSCDFVQDFAVPFPSAMFLGLMGLPYSDLKEFLVAKEGMIRPAGMTPEERRANQEETSAWIFAYFDNALNERATEMTDDILGYFVELEHSGRLTRNETLNICLLMLAAGLDTVTDTLGNAFAYLANNEQERRRLAGDLELAATAVEELLRYDTPVPIVTRITMSDTVLDGCPVAKDQRVRVLLSMPNHDVDVYGNPGEVDFDRTANPHIAFGAGVHRCLGSHLARLELRVAMQEWHRRIPEYTMRAGHEIRYRQGLREIEHLPLNFPTGKPL